MFGRINLLRIRPWQLFLFAMLVVLAVDDLYLGRLAPALPDLVGAALVALAPTIGLVAYQRVNR